MKLKHASKIVNGAQVIKDFGIITISATNGRLDKLSRVYTSKLTVEAFEEFISDADYEDKLKLLIALDEIVKGSAFLDDADIDVKLNI